MKIKIGELKKIIREMLPPGPPDSESEFLSDQELDELRDQLTFLFQSIKHLNINKRSLITFIDDLYDDNLNEE